ACIVGEHEFEQCGSDACYLHLQFIEEPWITNCASDSEKHTTLQIAGVLLFVEKNEINNVQEGQTLQKYNINWEAIYATYICQSHTCNNIQATLLISEAMALHYQDRLQTLEEIAIAKAMVTKLPTTKPSTLATASITLMYESNSNPISSSIWTTSTIEAAMAEWLRCSAHIHKIVCSNLGAIIHRITLDKLLTAALSRITHPIAR
ncbi:unnamed protein product, partial [Rotaria magnacalcarata]